MPDIFVGENSKPETTNSEDPVKPEEKEIQIEAKSVNPVHQAKRQIIHLQKDESHTHSHLFTAYCERPAGVNFIDILKEETLLLMLRKHFLTNFPWIISAIGLILVPFILAAINSFGILPFDFLPSTYIIFILFLYYFFVSGFIFVHYLTWFYNIGLVSNQRIIDIDFSSLVFENVDATKLSQVEDVGYVQIGIIRSIFDYGDVRIHTAGPTSNFDFLAVPHPGRIINVINDLIGGVKNHA